MIGTKDVEVQNPNDFVSKVLEPGAQVCVIHSVELRTPPYDKKAYDIVLHCEGPDLGEDFEGFFVDKDNEGLGRHKGQVGRIRLSQWSFADAVLKSGTKIYRDSTMLRALKALCMELGDKAIKWFDDQDDKHDTIEELFIQFNNDKVYEGIELRMCVSGKEYTNGQGYLNYDLFLGKTTKQGKTYENAEVSESDSELVSYDADKHIIKEKKKTADSFESEETEDLDDGLDLD